MNIIEQDRERYREMFGKRDKQKDYWAYSICSICYAECAIRVRVLDGKPVAVEGVPESDRGAQGGLCAKGVSAIMDWYDPNRILYPVKRTNPKKGMHENPGWERISWEEALDTITEKLIAARKKHPKSVFYGIAPSPTGGLRASVSFFRFFAALGGASSASGGPGAMCGSSAHLIGNLHYGAWDIIPDYRYCNYVLRCGGNEGWGGGRNASASIRLAAAARERGMKMRVMDPLGFTVASKGEEWIPILPATDIAVFLAIANLMVNEIGIYDKEYIRHKTNGSYLVAGPNLRYVRDEKTNKPLLLDEADGKVKTYDDPTLMHPAIEGKCPVSGGECQPVFTFIKEKLKQYKPGWASAISTVPADTIRRLAQELVDEARIGSFINIDGVTVPYRPACVVGYKGVQTHSNSFHQYCAMHLINMLLGNQDVCGGLLGSGTVRSLGRPETREFTFSVFGGLDGMLTAGAWQNLHIAWPPRKVEGPGTLVSFADIFSRSHSNIFPYAEDWEELWNNAGHPFEPEVYFFYGANVAMNCVRPESAEKFLRKFSFSFALQPFHNETTESFCDIVLPESHYLETLDIASSFGVTFNYPIGMDKWSFHVRMPVTEPRGEARDLQDVLNDLADRMGIRSKYNELLDDFYTFRRARQAGQNVEVSRIIEPEDRISNIELVDRILKYHFGEERGLEWFRDNGFITWDKRPEECYWRWFVNARVPIYYEGIEEDKEETRKRAEKIGFRLNWDYFTGMTSYFPSIIYTNPDPAHDLLLVSQRDPLMTQRFTAHNPYINEAALINPYTYSISMNTETARGKGIKDGDVIYLENSWGDKVKGNVKLTQLIHPQVIATVGLGSWAKGTPISRGKGVNPNALRRTNQNLWCPISGASEPTIRVKAYKQ